MNRHYGLTDYKRVTEPKSDPDRYVGWFAVVLICGWIAWKVSELL